MNGELDAVRKNEESMNISLKNLAVCVGFVCSSLVSNVSADGSNKMERFHLSRADCEWTNEMGEYIYRCIKANEGFNSHWCFNETIAVFCAVSE